MTPNIGMVFHSHGIFIGEKTVRIIREKVIVDIEICATKIDIINPVVIKLKNKVFITDDPLLSPILNIFCRKNSNNNTMTARTMV